MAPEVVTVAALALCGDDGHLRYEPEAGYLIDTEHGWKHLHSRDMDDLVKVTITYTPLPPKPVPPTRAERLDALTVACSRCGAPAGKRCFNLAAKKRKRIASFHAERVRAAATPSPAPADDEEG